MPVEKQEFLDWVRRAYGEETHTRCAEMLEDASGQVKTLEVLSDALSDQHKCELLDIAEMEDLAFDSDDVLDAD